MAFGSQVGAVGAHGSAGERHERADGRPLRRGSLAGCATLPADAPEGEWVRSDIEEHVRDEDSTFAWILEPMIDRTGFRIETTEYSADGFLAEYVATAV